jgi:hypothetical protein
MDFVRDLNGGFLCFWLTKQHEFDTISAVQSEEAEKYTETNLQREPLVGEKGRGRPWNTPWSWHPNRSRECSRRAPGAPVNAPSFVGTT